MDLEYDLPEDRIAIEAAEPRDAARLMVVPRREGEPGTQDRFVRDLPELLRRGDLLVFNTTRVLPARFMGVRVGTGGRMEGLFLSEAAGGGPRRWHIYIKGRHTRAGANFDLHGATGGPGGVRVRVLERSSIEPGAWLVEVMGVDGLATGAILERIGHVPLPPYILAARRHASHREEEGSDRERYQTVFARADQAASVAAPTAGLHFTPELLERLSAGGVARADVVLHVGSGTFRPVEAEYVEQHPMHSELCSMPGSTVEAIRRTRESGGRVIAVGTTSARTIEAFAAEIEEGRGGQEWLETRLLIAPGYRLRWVDGLMTNFHLPRSTLMALVSAFLDGDGVARLKGLYAGAIQRGYRFYSYGDAMLVL